MERGRGGEREGGERGGGKTGVDGGGGCGGAVVQTIDSAHVSVQASTHVHLIQDAERVLRLSPRQQVTGVGHNASTTIKGRKKVGWNTHPSLGSPDPGRINFSIALVLEVLFLVL